MTGGTDIECYVLTTLAAQETRIRRLEERMSEESDARDTLGVEVAAVGKRFDAGLAKLEDELAAAGVAPSVEFTDAIASMKQDAATLAAMHPDAPAAPPATPPTTAAAP